LNGSPARGDYMAMPHVVKTREDRLPRPGRAHALATIPSKSVLNATGERE